MGSTLDDSQPQALKILARQFRSSQHRDWQALMRDRDHFPGNVTQVRPWEPHWTARLHVYAKVFAKVLIAASSNWRAQWSGGAIPVRRVARLTMCEVVPVVDLTLLPARPTCPAEYLRERCQEAERINLVPRIRRVCGVRRGVRIGRIHAQTPSDRIQMRINDGVPQV